MVKFDGLVGTKLLSQLGKEIEHESQDGHGRAYPKPPSGLAQSPLANAEDTRKGREHAGPKVAIKKNRPDFNFRPVNARDLRSTPGCSFQAEKEARRPTVALGIGKMDADEIV